MFVFSLVCRTYPFESIVNYGMMPQTWEDSTKPDTHLKLIGTPDKDHTMLE